MLIVSDADKMATQSTIWFWFGVAVEENRLSFGFYESFGPIHSHATILSNYHIIRRKKVQAGKLGAPLLIIYSANV